MAMFSRFRAPGGAVLISIFCICCFHSQVVGAFSAMGHHRSLLGGSCAPGIRRSDMRPLRPELPSRPALLQTRAKLGHVRSFRQEAKAAHGVAAPFGSSFTRVGQTAVTDPAVKQLKRTKALKGWVGTGVYLYTKWQVSFGLNSVLAGLLFLTGKYKKMLTNAGLFHAWMLGVILWGSLGPGGWTTGAFYLAAGSRVTKIKMAEKEAKGIAEGRGGRRGPENVWGSAASAAICALLAALSPWDSGIFKLGFVASLATKLSDTFASEIGKAYGKTTYLITSLERVEPGTEGAVSLEGTLAGVVGSVLLAVWGLLAKQIMLEGVLLCIVAAFVATTCESYIGASLQGKIPWMTNEVVNFINTTIGAVVAMGLYALFF